MRISPCQNAGAPLHSPRMKRMEAADLLEALKWRYATKKFDSARKIDAGTWAALEETLVLSPSSFGLQPWKFFVIEDQSVKNSLVPHSWGQTQVAEASHVVIFAVKHPLTDADVRRHTARTAEVQGIPLETLAGFEKVVLGFVNNPALDVRSWSMRQLYIALGNFMTAAAVLGIDTCPMEGIDPAAYDKALGLEGTGYFTVAACPAGYRAADDKSATRKKVRFNAEDIVTRVGA
jgi:nitroreductase